MKYKKDYFGKVEVIKEAPKKKPNPEVPTHNHGHEIVSILNSDIKEFNQAELNISDAFNSKRELEYSQDMLLTLNHVLEDCDLNASEMIRIAKLIKLWRKRRRYYKSLYNIQIEGFKDFKDLSRKACKQSEILNGFKAKSSANRVLIFDAMLEMN